LLVALRLSDKHAVWNKEEFSNLNFFSSGQQKQSKSYTHVLCYIQLKLFGQFQRFDLLQDAQSRNDVNRHNERLKKNK